MFERSSLGILLVALALSTACSKNDGRSPGLIEGVANDVGNEIDGAGNSVDGVGKDVTNTLDGAPASTPPASDEAEPSAEAETPAADDAADEAASVD